MNSMPGMSLQWTPSRATQPLLGPKQQLPGLKQGLFGPKQALLGPKQGAVLLDQLASKYKRPGRKGLRGGQSYPKKHYSGLEGLCW